MIWFCCRCSTANITASFNCKRCRHAGDCCMDCYSYSRGRVGQDELKSSHEESPVA